MMSTDGESMKILLHKKVKKKEENTGAATGTATGTATGAATATGTTTTTNNDNSNNKTTSPPPVISYPPPYLSGLSPQELQVLSSKVLVAIDPNMMDLYYCIGRKVGGETWSRFRYTRNQRRYESGSGKRAYFAKYNKHKFRLSLPSPSDDESINHDNNNNNKTDDLSYVRMNPNIFDGKKSVLDLEQVLSAFESRGVDTVSYIDFVKIKNFISMYLDASGFYQKRSF